MYKYKCESQFWRLANKVGQRTKSTIFHKICKLWALRLNVAYYIGILASATLFVLSGFKSFEKLLNFPSFVTTPTSTVRASANLPTSVDLRRKVQLQVESNIPCQL